MNFDDLRKPFPPEAVSWRVGATNQDKSKGMALAYIDARDVMDRLDEVCGPANWQCRYSHAQGTVVCDLGIYILRKLAPRDSESVYEWVWKADGAGATDVEAEKGSLSDAFKRAAVRWGIGRYLYDLPDIWAAIEPKGRSYVIARKEYPRLHKILAGDADTTPPPTPPAEMSETQRLAQFVPKYLEKIAAAKTLDEIESIQSKNGAALKLAKERPALKRQIEEATKKRIDEVAGFSERADREIGSLEDGLTPQNTPF